MLSDITVLFPCHSLDDFPMHFRGADAEGLLSAWTAAWHPALLAAIGKTPAWHRADEPPADCSGRLLLVPSVAHRDLPDGFADQARQQGAMFVDSIGRRSALVDELLRLTATALPEAPHAPALANDFLALGFCYLQTEVLTRRMRYASHLDENRFQESALCAARAWTSGDEPAAKTALADCFNALVDAKSQFYAVDSYWIDVTLVEATTAGTSLRDELTGSIPRNVLISADVLQQLAASKPETLRALRDGLQRGSTSIIGGLNSTVRLENLSHEAILLELNTAIPIYEEILGRRPTVFGSRRFALTPVLPQILREIGFVGALQISFDEGRCPAADHTKTRWQGLDGSAIDALARPALDAGQSDSFLSLPEELNRTMDQDFVATVVMAHWPGYGSPFYDDLLRIAAYAPVLGKFVTVDEYFRDTSPPGVYSKFMPDQYSTTFLLQTTDEPISIRTADEQRSTEKASVEVVKSLAAFATGSAADSEAMPKSADAIGEAGRALAAAIPRTADAAQARYLLINPLGFTRQIGVDIAKVPNGTSGNGRGIIEVPPLGFTFFTADDLAPGRQQLGTAEPIVQNGAMLVNEFCEVAIHQETGGIRSIRDLRSRGNRLSQQVGVRLPAAQSAERSSAVAEDEGLYSTIAVESIQTEESDELFGKITSRARLLDSLGKQLAHVRQSISLWRGSRIVVLDFEISDCSIEFPPDRWNGYLACRFAWPDESATLRRSVHGFSFETRAKRIDAPQFVEVESYGMRNTILPFGMPYHRRAGKRMLDCLLRTHGESSTKFRLAIGIDVPHPWRAAQEMVSPSFVISENAPPPTAATGWFFHVDRPNISVTHCSPLAESGRVSGFRLRLLECEGRRGQLKLRSFRTPASARRVDLSGTLVSDLVVDGDAVNVDFGPYEWIQIEATW